MTPLQLHQEIDNMSFADLKSIYDFCKTSIDEKGEMIYKNVFSIILNEMQYRCYRMEMAATPTSSNPQLSKP